MAIYEFLRDYRSDTCTAFAQACLSLYNSEFSRSEKKKRESALAASRGESRPQTPGPQRPGTPSQAVRRADLRAVSRTQVAANPFQPLQAPLQSRDVLRDPPLNYNPRPDHARDDSRLPRMSEGRMDESIDPHAPPARRPANDHLNSMFQNGTKHETGNLLPVQNGRAPLSSNRLRLERDGPPPPIHPPASIPGAGGDCIAPVPVPRGELHCPDRSGRPSGPTPDLDWGGAELQEEFGDGASKRRKAVKEKALQRWKEMKPGDWKKPVPMSSDRKQYLLYKSDDPESVDAVIDVELVSKFDTLQNSSGWLSIEHAEVLRFMWMYLVSNRCTGAVLSDMGLGRVPLALAFFAMFASSRHGLGKPVLVVCPSHAIREWEDSVHRCLPDHHHVRFIDEHDLPARHVQDISEWSQMGGLLVLTEGQYLDIVHMKQSDGNDVAIRALCRPGPDIVILDEALRLKVMDPLLRRMLGRTKTRARLALTSSQLESNLFNIWMITDWAAPDFLGTQQEFSQVYVEPIAEGHRDAQLFVTDSREEQAAKSNEYQSRSERAFLAAYHLYNEFKLVSFTVGTTDRHSAMLSKAVGIQDVILYVNMGLEQSQVYTATASFLAKEVSEGHLSTYVASHVLQVAATSTVALEMLLKNGTAPLLCEDLGRTFCSSGFKGALHAAHKALKNLYGVLDPYLSPRSPCSKIRIALEMFRLCKVEREHMVVFASKYEVQMAFSSALEIECEPGSHVQRVFLYDLSLPADSRAEILRAFHDTAGGAVLVAPFGPTVECIESSGWGTLQASRVLIVDCSWHQYAEAQAASRVHNTAQKATSIQVLHLASAQTIERGMYAHLLNDFAKQNDERATCRPFPVTACGSYLLHPELEKASIIDLKKVDYDVFARSEPIINRSKSTADALEADRQRGDLFGILLNLRFTGQHFVVAELTAELNRTLATAESLQVALRVRRTQDVMNAARKQYERGLSLQRRKAQDVLESLLDGVDGHGPTAKSFAELLHRRDMLYKPGTSSVCTLAACWEPYFEMFECEQVAAESPGPSRGEYALPAEGTRRGVKRGFGIEEHPRPLANGRGHGLLLRPEGSMSPPPRNVRRLSELSPIGSYPQSAERPRESSQDGRPRGRGAGRGRRLTAPAWMTEREKENSR